MHIVIIGNGILALTTAFRIAQKSGYGAKITLIGPKFREGSATLAAPAMLNSFAEIEKDSLTLEIDRHKFDLSIEATKLWTSFEKLVRGTANDMLPSANVDTPKGTYVINNTAADDLDDENFDAILECLKEYQEPHRLVSPADIPNYMPEQRHRATRALLIENEGWINPPGFILALEKSLTLFGCVSVIDSEISSLNCYQGKVKYATLANGTLIDGDVFLLATGANVTDILEKSNVSLKLPKVFYGVGVSVEIKSSEFRHTNCIRTPNRGLACGLYTAPYRNYTENAEPHIIVGASNFISPTPYHFGRLTSVEGLLRGAIEQINHNFYRADFVKMNLGWRPTSQDTYPLIGGTSLTNLFIATGTKREGFHLSPLISEYLSELILFGKEDKRFSFFKPERKLIKSLKREEAISKAVRHYVSAAYQHGFSPSKNRMPDQLKNMYREDLERLHDKIGADDWGIPPEMIDMYRYWHAQI